MHSQERNRQVFSQNLSRVLEDIGINDDVVQRRRQTFLHIEAMFSIHAYLSTVHFFGSQTEGTTTIDSESDFDVLYYQDNVTIIQSDREKQFGNLNLLMVKDAKTAPGYCRLYLLDKNENFLAFLSFQGGFHYMLENRKICILNKVMFGYFRTLTGRVNRNNSRRGPSKLWSKSVISDFASKDISNYNPVDDVGAFAFASWPSESIDWISKKKKTIWPTKQMIKKISKHTCLLVPVGHKESDRNMAEWRISYSFTERYLMFSMNIIQLQCYVLLKLIKKSFLGKKVTSYHLKNLLFYTVARTDGNDWTKTSLFSYALLCLKTLSMWVQAGYCPQFISPKVNLFQGQFSFYHRKALFERLQYLIENDFMFLLKIKVDMLGPRISAITTNVQISDSALSKSDIATHINKTLSYAQSNYKSFFINDLFLTGGISFRIFVHVHSLKHGSLQEQAAAIALLPGLIGHSAFIELSNSISKQKMDHKNELIFARFGIIHDLFSMTLKYATVCYRLGDMNQTLDLIEILESWTHQYKVYTCCSLRFAVWYGEILTADSMFANCVRFLRKEISICPPTLVFEMFRTTKYDKQFRYQHAENWMDTAEIDPVPYMFYLKYLTYRHLDNFEEASNSICELINQLECPYLSHYETVWNVLGKHFSDICQTNLAFNCYYLSLKSQPVNNAAKWHLALLVYSQLNKH